MKLMIINGCNKENPLQNKVLDYLEKNKTIINAEWIDIDNTKYCMGCDYCQTINPGFCAINDSQNEVLKRYMNSDKVVIITPVKFGCCSSTVKNFIDRTEPLFLPYQVLKGGKSVMKGRYDKYPDLVFIGVCDNENNASAETFKKFINTCNLSAASSKVSVRIISNNTDITDIKELML